MQLFFYDAKTLPDVTLLNRNFTKTPHQNIRRVSEDYIWYLITDGEFHFEENGCAHVLKKGDCFLFEPGLLHFGTAATYHQFYYIHFRLPGMRAVTMEETEWLQKAYIENKEWMTNLDGHMPSQSEIVLPKRMHFDDPLILADLIAMLEKTIERSNIRLENHNTLCACAVQEIFIALHRQLVFTSLQKANRGAESTYRIQEVTTYLSTNYKRKLTGKLIEKELSYNFDYLNQLVRKHLDTSIFQMLEAIRMEAAKNLIRASTLSMEQIANEVGFKDETYFSKVFKKNTGFSPLRYRKQIKTNPLSE